MPVLSASTTGQGINGSRWVLTWVGETDRDGFGKSVAISSDGNRIAVGAPWHKDSAGHVRMYDLTTRKQWTQVGVDLIGRTKDQYFGWSIALSSDGNCVVIGAPNLRSSGHAGHVEIYDWKGSQWRKTGSELVGHADRGGCGDAVVISSNGNRVAILADCSFAIEGKYRYVCLYDLGESCL